MKKEQILTEIKDILLLEEINENSEIEIDSMANLLLIAFLDENFSIHITSEKIKLINNVSNILDLIGKKNIDE